MNENKQSDGNCDINLESEHKNTPNSKSSKRKKGVFSE